MRSLQSVFDISDARGKKLRVVRTISDGSSLTFTITDGDMVSDIAVVRYDDGDMWDFFRVRCFTFGVGEKMSVADLKAIVDEIALAFQEIVPPS